jgi:hypothetical protein
MRRQTKQAMIRRLGKNMSEMIHLHPLVFTLQDVVTGCGFLAGIVVTGKAVMEHEDGNWWMYGVCPGAIAGSGATPNEAFIDFRNRYKEALFDIAEECKGFEKFQEAVEDFYTEDKQESVRWEEALAILRKNEQCVTEPFKSMPRKRPDEYELHIQIIRLEKLSKSSFKPARNIQDSLAKAA